MRYASRLEGRGHRPLSIPKRVGHMALTRHDGGNPYLVFVILRDNEGHDHGAGTIVGGYLKGTGCGGEAIKGSALSI